MNMSYGKDGIYLTKDFEKCRLVPYRDGGGVWTNGWGNTHHVLPDVVITQERADADLLANVQDAVAAVNDYTTVPLTQGQFDALVDFTFNVGVTAFKTSTLLKKLNMGDYKGAHDEFDRWNLDNGKIINGLIRRRDEEQGLFAKETAPASPVPSPVSAPVPLPLETQRPTAGGWGALLSAVLGYFARKPL
jgi:lysozyme